MSDEQTTNQLLAELQDRIALTEQRADSFEGRLEQALDDNGQLRKKLRKVEAERDALRHRGKYSNIIRISQRGPRGSVSFPRGKST